MAADVKSPVPPRRLNPSKPRPVAVARPAPGRKGTELLGSKKQGDEINARKQEKKKAGRRLVLTRLVLAVIAILLIVGAIWLFFFSPVFGLRESMVKVSSEQTELDLSAVTNEVANDIGHPLPRLNTSNLKKRILEDPRYLDATIKRRWPDGLDIVVTARQPIFSLVSDKGFDLIAADGITVGHQNEPGPGTTKVRLAANKTLTPTQTTEIKTVMDALDPRLAEQVDTASYSAGLITLHLSNGTQIAWGSSADSTVKNQVATILIENRNASIYDVTDPTRPSIR